MGYVREAIGAPGSCTSANTFSLIVQNDGLVDGRIVIRIPFAFSSFDTFMIFARSASFTLDTDSDGTYDAFGSFPFDETLNSGIDPASQPLLLLGGLENKIRTKAAPGVAPHCQYGGIA